jgi:uncharacterized protein (TIGR03000 family)
MSILQSIIFPGIVLLGGVAAFPGSADRKQPPSASEVETDQPPLKSKAEPATPQIHYHYHYHLHVHSSPLGIYPGYDSPYVPGGPMTSFPLPYPYRAPTQAHPYPSWYLPGLFAAPPFENTNPRAPRDKGVIDVFLPVADAKVYLNGQEMRGTGKNRTLTTPLLPLNQEYQYYVTVRYKKDGETVTDYRKLDLGAGEYTVADFTRPPLDNPGKLPPGPVNQNEVVPVNPDALPPKIQ